MSDRMLHYWGFVIALGFCTVCAVHILNFLGL